MTQRRSLIEQMNRMLGFEGRRYREGLLFFHPDLTGEAQLFPTLSGLSDLVLLVAGELRKQLYQESPTVYTEADGTIRMSRSEMETILLRLRDRHKEYWSKEHQTMPSSTLADQLFAHMEEWGLGNWEDENYFLIYPVLGRWNAEYMVRDFEA
jgi:hypothetical protein